MLVGLIDVYHYRCLISAPKIIVPVQDPSRRFMLDVKAVPKISVIV